MAYERTYVQIVNKLDTIETNADVTDATNVAAAGAVMATSAVFTFETVLGTILNELVVMPACTVTKFDTVVMGPTTDTAPETLTFSNETGAMTGGVVTIASGSAAGVTDTATPTTNNTFAAGEKMTCAVGGENGQATITRVTVHYTMT